MWIWWQPSSDSGATRYGFTTIQLHLPPGGAGEGKLSVTSVAADKDAGVLIGDYAREPALMTDVKRELAS